MKNNRPQQPQKNHQSTRRNTKNMFVLILASLLLSMTTTSLPFVQSFTISPSFKTTPTTTIRNSNSLFAKNQKKSSSSTTAGQFELQELRAQLQTMKTKSISSRYLTPEKRMELSTYLANLVSKAPSPIAPEKIGPYIKGRTWRLAFSTEEATLGDLPREATVLLRIGEEEETLDYVLKFSKKVWGLSELTAKCDYMIDTGPVNPGLLTFIYQNIQTDMFGFKNLPVGFFGLLKNRANYVETIWFDGQMWIDRGYNLQGVEYYNVYWMEEEEDEEWQK